MLSLSSRPWRCHVSHVTSSGSTLQSFLAYLIPLCRSNIRATATVEADAFFKFARWWWQWHDAWLCAASTFVAISRQIHTSNNHRWWLACFICYVDKICVLEWTCLLKIITDLFVFSTSQQAVVRCVFDAEHHMFMQRRHIHLRVRKRVGVVKPAWTVHLIACGAGRGESLN